MSRPAKLTPAPDVFSALCPSRGVLDHATSRWAVLVLSALAEQMCRFSVLRRRVGGVSEKMLAQTLTTLEHDGFVTRTAYAEVPPRVEYRLTPLGRGLAERLEVLVRWIEKNVHHVVRARQAGGRVSRRRAVSRAAS